MRNDIISPELYRRLVDDMSQVYYAARQSYRTDQKLSSFYKTIRSLNVRYRFRDVENYLSSHVSKGWIIWGNDDVSYYHYLLLQDSQFHVLGTTNFNLEDRLPNVPFLKFEDSVRMVRDEGYTLLITEQQLTKRVLSFFAWNNMLIVNGHLVGRCGWQYFDYFQPNKNEVFIDGGALDGRTSLEFVKWCDDRFSKIYLFEPNTKMYHECKQTISILPSEKYKFYGIALWNKKCQLLFANEAFSKWDAHVSDTGDILVNADTIDHLIVDTPVTFIKLDVEGSELETLEGASETIKRYHPRMAISVYHKKDDLFNIADYVMTLYCGYRFAIRHYHSDAIETILYAF